MIRVIPEKLLFRSTDWFVVGDLLLVDVENKDIAFSKKTESKVTSLVWVQQEKPRKKDTIDSVLVKVIVFTKFNALFVYNFIRARV